MLSCIYCKTNLLEVPVFNNAQDEAFPPAFLFCNNDKCPRSGLLTVVFESDEEENKEGGDKGIQPEPVPTA